jgi:hypothetical protein
MMRSTLIGDSVKARVDEKGRMVLLDVEPAAVGLHPGDEVGVVLTDPDQEWFWSEEWQRGERQAQADIAAGRVRHFGSDEEFFAYLDRLDAEAEGEPSV